MREGPTDVKGFMIFGNFLKVNQDSDIQARLLPV
jgi:selenophosphate synthase